jgi:membrane fusion protein (multidrug efflux system)
MPSWEIMGMNKTARKLIQAGALVLSLEVGLVGCKQEAASLPAPGPPEVQVATVTTQTLVEEPEFVGQSESSRPVEIRSQVTGLIKERFFREGRDVKQGAKLYRIDPVPFEAAVLTAKATVAQAEARLIQAKQNLARVKPLLAEQAVSQKDVDDAVAEGLAAKASLEAAKGQLVKAKFDLDNTLITAPISGMIERTKVYEGRLVAAQTDLLTVIHQIDPMYVTASLPENYILQQRRELAARQMEQPDQYRLKGVITFADGSIYPHEGALDLLDVGLRTDTGSRDARFVFPNPTGALLPGQFVRLRVKGYTRPSAILVPQRAVQQGPKGPIVFVVGEGDKVEIRPVQATSWQGTQWLVEDGLKSGERVIVEGVHRIQPGAPVKPVPVEQSAGGAESAPPADRQSNGPADQPSNRPADSRAEQTS